MDFLRSRQGPGVRAVARANLLLVDSNGRDASRSTGVSEQVRVTWMGGAYPKIGLTGWGHTQPVPFALHPRSRMIRVSLYPSRPVVSPCLPTDDSSPLDSCHSLN